MEIRININNCSECPNYKFYKKCKVLNIKVNKNGINEKCPINKTLKTENKTSENKQKSIYVGKNYKYNVAFYKELLERENPNKEFIKRLIKSKGLSYRKIAELMQVDKKTICRLIKWNVYKSKVSNQRLLSFILKTDRKELFPNVVKENEKDKIELLCIYADSEHIGNYEEVINEKYTDYNSIFEAKKK